MRWRVISIRPKGLVRRILVRARSRFTASRSARSTPRRCFSLRMSMKSLTITPPRSRRRSWRAISLAAMQVHLVGGFLGRVVGAEVAAVDVDGHQGLGLVDDDRAARPSSGTLAAVDFGDFLVEVVLAEQRLLALVELEAVDVAGHDQLQELLGPLVGRRLVDVDRVDVGGEDVADGADDHVAFFVDVRRGGQFLDPPDDDLPEPQQVGHVAGELASWCGRCRRCGR